MSEICCVYFVSLQAQRSLTCVVRHSLERLLENVHAAPSAPAPTTVSAHSSLSSRSPLPRHYSRRLEAMLIRHDAHELLLVHLAVAVEVGLRKRGVWRGGEG